MPQDAPDRRKRPPARTNHAADLEREIRAHLELETEERIADGAASEEAHYAARRAFGNVTLIREQARDVWVRPWADHLRQDVRYALRVLGRSPGFTAVAILTLALGIGANTAIFTVVNAVLLRPLPFAESDRLVRLFEDVPATDGSVGPRRTSPMAASALDTFRSHVKALSHVGVHIPTIRTLTGRAEPVRIIGVRLSPDLLSTLRTQPQLGRIFAAHEDSPGAEAVVILSHGTWQRHFGGDPNVVGQSAVLDGRAHTIVGVMPGGFSFLDPRDEFWMPLPRSSPLMAQRLPMTARLRDGMSPEAAIADITSTVSGMRGDTESAARPDGGVPPRLALVRLRDLVVAPVRQTLIVLAAAVAFVLLIACANVANLLLARAASRQRELVLRFALGAGRGRLIRQALTESLVIALMGGVAGIGLAFGGVALLRAFAASLPRRDLGPGIGFPRLEEIAVDGTALTFTLVVAMAAGVMFGLIPALRQSRSQSIDALRQGTASAISGFNIRGHLAAQGSLVVAQVALAMMLFVGGGLLIHSLVRMSRVNPGYDPNNVLTFQVSLAANNADAALKALARDLAERIDALPGVTAVGYAEALPMTRVSARFAALSTSPPAPGAILRRPPQQGPISPSRPDVRLVSSGFLAAMGMKTVAGRAFDDRDRAGQPRVMLVNQALARSGFLGENPVGRTVYTSNSTPFQIVGIVDDVRQFSLIQDPDPQIFIDFRQVDDAEPLTGVGLYFGVRIDGASTPIVASIRSLVRQLDARAMVETVAPMEQLVSNSIARPRLYAVMLNIFAAIAVVLAATGIYGVIAFAVAQRTREIAVRMALGARQRQVIGLVLGQSLTLTIAGMALGLGAAALVTRYLEQLLFGLTPVDPATFTAVFLAFALVALIAAFIPARRAANVDPLIALRAE